MEAVWGGGATVSDSAAHKGDNWERALEGNQISRSGARLQPPFDGSTAAEVSVSCR